MPVGRHALEEEEGDDDRGRDAREAPRAFATSWTQVKKTASTIADPIAGKYQKRSARTVGRTTGMLEWGK